MQQFKNEAEEPSSPSHSSPGPVLGGGGSSLGMIPLSMRTKVAGDSTGLGALGSIKPAALTSEHGEVLPLGELAGLTVINEATLIGTEVSRVCSWRFVLCRGVKREDRLH